MRIEKAYTFDDLMLVPQYSEVQSRKRPDVSNKLGYLHLELPVIAAPMNTICEQEMLKAMEEIGAVGALHRYMGIEDQVKEFDQADCWDAFVAIGASGDYLERAKRLLGIGARNFVIDVANGHNINTIRATKEVRMLKDVGLLMSGNVCTYEGAIRLIEAGADIIRVGIGPGSACTTRKVTGHGVPQLTAIDHCVQAVKDENAEVHIVADGGIRSSGDIVKALAMGADAVMLGGLLAGTSQTPGEAHNSPGGLYKYFHGMASREGREKWFNRDNTSFVPEGGSAKVPFRGDARKIVKDLFEAVQVGMGYSGAHNLKELRDNAMWVEVSQNGYIEGSVNRRMHGGKE